jgi:hypothetical protein
VAGRGGRYRRGFQLNRAFYVVIRSFPDAHPSITNNHCESSEVDQIPLTDALRVVEEGLNHVPSSDGVPIASVETIVIMKLLAGRTQDLADVEAIIASGADREFLTTTVQRTIPDYSTTLQRLFVNVDNSR